MYLVYASSNPHKLKEVQNILSKESVTIIPLSDISCYEKINETGHTLEENALIKARYVFRKYNMDVFAEDSGLEIPALNYLPGVFSARYAGDHRSDSDNINLVLEQLKDFKDRNSRFRTIIALILKDREYLFEGKISGHIALNRMGSAGFGYDSVFIPTGSEKSFGEMLSSEKNKISHRKKALTRLSAFLRDYK